MIVTLNIGLIRDVFGFITAPPAVQLSLQQSDGVLQCLVFLLLFFPFVLPLFRGQLHIQNYCVFDCLCPAEREWKSIT